VVSKLCSLCKSLQAFFGCKNLKTLYKSIQN
jgi:hypothetical protein